MSLVSDWKENSTKLKNNVRSCWLRNCSQAREDIAIKIVFKRFYTARPWLESVYRIPEKNEKHEDSGILNVCAETTALIQMLKIWTMLGIPRIDEITLSFCRKFKNTISSRQPWYRYLRLSRYTVYIHANRPGKRPPVRSNHNGFWDAFQSKSQRSEATPRPKPTM